MFSCNLYLATVLYVYSLIYYVLLYSNLSYLNTLCFLLYAYSLTYMLVFYFLILNKQIIKYEIGEYKMRKFKLVNNPVDTDKALENLCNYIINPKKKCCSIYVNSRGISTENAYNEILDVQRGYKKLSERKAYHFVLGFNDHSVIAPCEAVDLAYEVSNLFYPEFQVVYGVHDKDNLHIHFAVNSVSHIDGKELILERDSLNGIRKNVYALTDQYLFFNE